MMKLTVIGGVIAIGLVVALGLYLFGLGLRNVGRAAASSRWPGPRGRSCAPIRRCSMMSIERRGRLRHLLGRHSDSIRGRREAVLDEPDSLWPDARSGDASEAELQHLRYPVDGEVSVSYDPPPALDRRRAAWPACRGVLAAGRGPRVPAGPPYSRCSFS